MDKIFAAIATFALLGGALIIATPAEASSYTNPSPRSDSAMAVGMDSLSIGKQSSAGVKPDYGSIWVGPWVLKSGWGHVNGQLDNMRSKGVTPAIHFYYWGDDISKSCIENGCYSSLHGVQKNKAGWQKLAQELNHAINSRMGGKPVVIFLETEFNKGGVENYEPLDAYLRDKANYFKWNTKNVHINLAFGNWNSAAWGTFDRAAAASHSIGIQGMRGSTKDSYSSYTNLYEATLSGAKKAKSVFGKPIIIHDIALSSYPSSTYLQPQANELKQFFSGIGQLKAAGVKGMIYRSWSDNPNFNTANYYGIAERHWGVAYADGKWKPSASAWVNGVKAERSGSTTSTTTSTSTSTGTFSASFAPSSSVNEWWVDVAVKGNQPIAKVHVKVDGGSWTALSKSSWGTWTKSLSVPKGSSVIFKATSSTGEIAKSGTYEWMSSTSTTTSTTSTSTSTFSAKFAPSSSINEWWVDVGVTSSKTVSKVHVKVNGGSWIALDKTSWGTWAKSTHVPKGSSVVFKATSSAGEVAKSQTFTWMSASSTSTTSTFSASFAPSNSVNEWWVDVGVKSSKTVSKVHVKVNGGSWIALDKTSWGTWAKSTHVPKGSSVVFKATSSSGETATSQTYKW